MQVHLTSRRLSGGGWVAFNTLPIALDGTNLALGDSVHGVPVTAHVNSLWIASGEIDCSIGSAIEQIQVHLPHTIV
jgi:hypothetical protein